MENAMVGDLVSDQVEAVGGAGNIQYSIIAGNDDGIFAIENENVGDVTVAMATLDFETTPTYMLEIQATSSPGGATATAILTINVIDVNEPPVFQTPCAINGDCTFSVDENLDDELVDTIVAIDPDTSAPFNELVYTIITPGVPFAINSNGEIRTTESLDREMIDSYTFVVTVVNVMFDISTSVTVNVNDVNDNAPMFVVGATGIFILETEPVGDTQEIYRATDADIGVNAIIIFSLDNSSLPMGELPLQINNVTGELTLSAPVDFEDVNQRSFTFDVVISNPDGLSSRRSVLVWVTNFNDNTPQFEQFPYFTSVVENSPLGTLVENIIATDADEGDNVTYSILTGNVGGAFAINSRTGALTVAGTIDRENISMYTLMVEATDGTLANVTDVFITVIDVNDNSPIFEPDLYEFDIPENFAPGLISSVISATDADDPATPNGQITYTLTSNTDVFAIDPNTADFSLIDTLDFETVPFYRMIVVASDGSGRADTATIEVTVLNVNEHPPETSGNETVSVLENEPAGFEVVQVTATDMDMMMVTFTLQVTNPSSAGLFEIESTSGVVSLAAPLDFETQTVHVLEVIASDGTLSSTAFITVNVVDINEFSPVVMASLAVSIDEEEPSGTQLTTVVATDADGSDMISFSIVPGRISSFFAIDANGVITTTQVLDREALGVFVNPEILVVRVSDNGLIPGPNVVNATIRVTLNDINDNAPMFFLDVVNVDFEEEQFGNVIQVSAIDIDIGVNAEIAFTLVDEGNLPFTIRSNTGIISNNARIDRETQAFYTLTVTATDGGTPSLSSNATVNVLILDINDNAPVFDMDIYTFDVSEDTSVPASLFSVSATDIDDVPNNIISYSIFDDMVCDPLPTPIPPQCFFSIVSFNGSLVLERSLDFETNEILVFNVTARDGGTPSLDSTAQVQLTVLNVDEAPPGFDGPCDVAVPEDIVVPRPISNCTATDFDFNGAPIVTYAITQGDTTVFSINEDGVISVIQSLNRENIDSYDLVVTATDGAGLSTDIDVVITVEDVNDNAPVFVGAPYAVDLSDDDLLQANRGDLESITALATDADIGANGAVTYAIDDVQTGLLSSVLTLTASDGGDPMMSATTTADITFESLCEIQRYTIDSNTGLVDKQLLCNIDIFATSGTVVVLNSQIVLECTVVRVTNETLTVTFRRDGNFLQTEILQPGDESVFYVDDDAMFQDEGTYTCSAELPGVGTIATQVGVDITIAEPPSIVTAPRPTLFNEGELGLLTCTVDGTPDPVITWMTPLGDAANNPNFIVDTSGLSSTIQIPDIDLIHEGFYTCVATNLVGVATAEALVEVETGEGSSIVLTISNVAAPDPPNNCNHFDSDAFATTLSGIIGQTVSTTGVEGEGVCPSGPCSPNPCANGGICTEHSNGLFTCECVGGYSGGRCEEEVDECANGIACSNGGTCVNLQGSYNCLCPGDFFGSACQFNHAQCDCPPDYTCSESRCEVNPDAGSNNLVIESPTQSENTMNQIVNTINEELASPTTNKRKRKRDTESFSGCVAEFRFRAGERRSYYLAWLCPEDAQTPSAEHLVNICYELVRLQVVKSCSTPDGFEQSLNEVPPSDVEVRITAVDRDTNVELSVEELMDLIESTGALQLLVQQGYNVTTVVVNSPTTAAIESDDDTMTWGIVGGVVGGAVLVAVIAIVVVIILVKRRRRKRHQVPTNDMVLSDINEPQYSKVNKPKSVVLTNTDVAPDVSGNDYGLFDKTNPVKTSIPNKRQSIKKTDSTDNLLEESDYDTLDRTNSITTQDITDDEPIYGNMDYKWEGHKAGERWENYWKTETVVRGTVLKKQTK